VDIFSDYASVSSSGNGSDASRSSDEEAGEASSGPAGASGSIHPGNGGESDDSLAPLPEAGEGPSSPAKLARTPSAPIASRRSEPGERELTGSLQRCTIVVFPACAAWGMLSGALQHWELAVALCWQANGCAQLLRR
jgi:hypothetical protein